MDLVYFKVTDRLCNSRYTKIFKYIRKIRWMPGFPPQVLRMIQRIQRARKIFFSMLEFEGMKTLWNEDLVFITKYLHKNLRILIPAYYPASFENKIIKLIFKQVFKNR